MFALTLELLQATRSSKPLSPVFRLLIPQSKGVRQTIPAALLAACLTIRFISNWTNLNRAPVGTAGRFHFCADRSSRAVFRCLNGARGRMEAMQLDLCVYAQYCGRCKASCFAAAW